MTRFWQTPLFGLAMLFSSVTVTEATTLTTSLVVGETYDLAGNPLSNSFINDGTSHIYRVDILSAVTGLGTNESYGGESFNLTLNGASLSRNTLTVSGPALTAPKPNYVPNDPTISNIVDGSSFAPIPDFFADGKNGDLGTSASDLIGILTAINPTNLGNTLDGTTFGPVPDPRQAIGIGTPFRLGSVYLKWNGDGVASLTLNQHMFDTANALTHQFNIPAVQNLPNTVLTFSPVPEPSTWALFGIGGILLFRRRRRLTKIDR